MRNDDEKKPKKRIRSREKNAQGKSGRTNRDATVLVRNLFRNKNSEDVNVEGKTSKDNFGRKQQAAEQVQMKIAAERRKKAVLEELRYIIKLDPEKKLEMLEKNEESKALRIAYLPKLELLVQAMAKFTGIVHYCKSAEEAEVYFEQLKSAKAQISEALCDVIVAEERRKAEKYDYAKFLEEQIMFIASGLGDEKKLAKKRAELSEICIQVKEEAYGGIEIKRAFDSIFELAEKFVKAEDSARSYFEFSEKLGRLLCEKDSVFELVFFENATAAERIYFELASNKDVCYPAIKCRFKNEFTVDGKARGIRSENR